MCHRVTCVVLFLALSQFGAHAVEGNSPLGEKVKKGLKDHVSDFWIYDDIPGAVKKARATGKPLLVSFR